MLFAVAIAGMTFIFSCGKNNETLLTHHAANNTTNRYTPCSGVENPANPYDQAGLEHNNGVQYILDHKSEWVCDDEGMKQVLVNLDADFACNMNYGTPPSNCQSEAHTLFTQQLNQNLGRSAEDLILSAGTSAGQDFMFRLKDAFDTYNDSTQVDSLLAAIKVIENDAMNSSLSPDEKQAFLQASSIARYSVCYWSQDGSLDQSEWTHCPDGGSVARINWRKVLGCAMIDAASGWAASPLGPWAVVGIGLLMSVGTYLL